MKLSSEKKFVLDGHKGPVYGLLQLDENHFLSAGSDRLAVKWNSKEMQEGIVVARASDSIYSLCLSENKNQLLIGQGSGSVHVVNLFSGEEIKLLKLHDTPVFKICRFATLPYYFCLGGDGSLNIISEDFSSQRLFKLSATKLRSIVFNTDAQLIYIGTGDGIIFTLDAITFKIKDSFQAHQEGFGVNAMCISHNGTYLLTGSRDAHLHIYNTDGLQLLKSIPAHHSAIYDIAFHHSGNYFATASRDKSLKIWDALSFDVLLRIDKEKLDAHSYSVNCCIWMDDLLISSGDDRTVIVNEVTK
ncbi:MAG: WD40 repeat domain-containing protein [Bacteroidota bacterium]